MKSKGQTTQIDEKAGFFSSTEVRSQLNPTYLNEDQRFFANFSGCQYLFRSKLNEQLKVIRTLAHALNW